MEGPEIKSPRSVWAAKLLEFPDIVFADRAAFQHRHQWRALFRTRIGPAFDDRVVVEIGCFDAAYLTRIAIKHPNTAFVGIDWKARPIYDGARQLDAAGIRNVILLRGRGQELLRLFAYHEVDELWLFHPDPFDRPVEAAGRLVTAPFLSDAAAVLRPRSRFCFKTDHAGYYQHLLKLVDESAFSVNVNTTDLWNDAVAIQAVANRGFAGERTHFEDRFIKRRQPIHYVELQTG